MSVQTRQALLSQERRRYAAAGRPCKTQLLKELVELIGYHRKAARRLEDWLEPSGMAVLAGVRGGVQDGADRSWREARIAEKRWEFVCSAVRRGHSRETVHVLSGL